MQSTLIEESVGSLSTSVMDPITIVIVNDFGHIEGGASAVAIAEAMGLAQAGFPVIYFCGVPPLEPGLTAWANSTVICTQQQDILSDSNRIRAAGRGLWNSLAADKLRQVLRGLDPAHTVVHLHGWTKSLSSSVVRAARDCGFHVVCTIHDYFLACPNGGFYNYPKNQICRLEALSLPCLLSNCDARRYTHKLWRFSRSLVQRSAGWLPNGVQHFITVSHFSHEIVTPYLPLECSVYRVDNPVEVERAAPVRVSDQKSFVAVGRLAQEKGCLLLARAALAAGADLMFVGEGPSRAEIVRVNPDAVITGWLKRDQVVQALNQSRVLVFPSLLYETQGLVVLEAAALGVPAIVPDTSAARELVIDGQTGLWFQGGSVEDLHQKMMRLTDDKFVSQLGNNAYDHYWQSPKSLKNHVNDLTAVYQRILVGRSVQSGPSALAC